MESRVQTFDNTLHCLYFTIPPFLQFLNYNSQTDVSWKHVSCFHASPSSLSVLKAENLPLIM